MWVGERVGQLWAAEQAEPQRARSARCGACSSYSVELPSLSESESEVWALFLAGIVFRVE